MSMLIVVCCGDNVFSLGMAMPYTANLHGLALPEIGGLGCTEGLRAKRNRNALATVTHSRSEFCRYPYNQ
jgi:hypothetical protein